MRVYVVYIFLRTRPTSNSGVVVAIHPPTLGDNFRNTISRAYAKYVLLLLCVVTAHSSFTIHNYIDIVTIHRRRLYVIRPTSDGYTTILVIDLWPLSKGPH